MEISFQYELASRGAGTGPPAMSHYYDFLFGLESRKMRIQLFHFVEDEDARV
jgi:hypothetical protein